jgi:hypothetical protein
MNHSVQYIPIVIPGSGADGPTILKILNMSVSAIVFVYFAIHARNITVSTQNTVVQLVTVLRAPKIESHETDEETQQMVNNENDK